MARADWGTRAKIKVYRLEPIIDRLRGSENKYITIYAEPITEEKLKIDQGSGRYRLYFNYKEPAGLDKEVDSIELDVMDMNFPPKVPAGEWVDDARNKKWAWARPAGAPGGPPAQAPLENAYETVLEIQDRERTRNGEKTSDIDRFTGMVTAVKTLLPEAPKATDNTMLNTIVTLLTAQIQSSQKEAQDLRGQVFQLIQKQTENSGKAMTLESLIEKSDTWMPKLKGATQSRGRQAYRDGARPAAAMVAGTTARYRPAAHFKPRAHHPYDDRRIHRTRIRPAANGMNGQQQPQAPAALPAGQPAQTNPMQALQIEGRAVPGGNIKPVGKFFEDFVSGKLTDPSDPESKTDGVDFAMWVCDYHGEEILKDARALGSAQIMQMFRLSPYWIHMQKNEAKLAEFLDQALQYSPEAEPEPEGPIDLSGGRDA